MKKNITISYSKVSNFKACPQKYYLLDSYQVKITASAFPFGNAVEAGIDALLAKKPLEEARKTFAERWKTAPENKWEAEKQIYDSEDVFYYASDYDEYLISEEDEVQVNTWKKELLPDSKETWDALIAEFQGRVKNNSYLDPALRKFAHRVIWTCCLRRGEIMLEAFKEQLLPEIEEVIANQEWINVSNEDGDKLVGKLDLILKLKGYDRPVLIDLKTAGKFYSEHDLNTSDQLSSYAASKKLDLIGYMVVLKNIKHEKMCNTCNRVRENNRKTNCEDEKSCKGKYTKVRHYGETQILVRELRKGEAQEVLEDFSDVLVAIKNGVNWKNPGSCFDFNKKCDFYDFCWNGKKIEDLPGVVKKKN